jgi:hypothetical protein
MDTELSPQDAAKALKEAQAKGLPEGWSVKLDVSVACVMKIDEKIVVYSNIYFFRNVVEENGLPPMANHAILSPKPLLSRSKLAYYHPIHPSP